jgi:hypothetical protein
LRLQSHLHATYQLPISWLGGGFGWLRGPLLDPRAFNAVTVNPDFDFAEWPGDVDLCPDALHQAITGSESEAELYSAAAWRENAKKNQIPRL